MASRLRRLYGAHPTHLLTLLGCFALTGYVLVQLLGNPSLPRIAVWFVGAAVLHDLVAFPVYAFADRLLGRVTARSRASVPPLRNYLRLPAAASALLFVVYLPGIVRQGAGTYRAATGQTQQPFLLRWLLLSAGFALLSALCFAARCWRARRRRAAR